MKRLGAIAVGVAITAVFGACSSSSSSNGATTTSTRAGAACPFDGTTTSQTNPAYPAGVGSTLSGVVPTVSGCIDQVRFNFDGALPPSTVGYTNASATSQLVMQLGTAVPPNNVPSTVTYSGPTSVPPAQLQHVKSINVTSANGVVTVAMNLDAQSPFQVSVSQKPQYIVVSLASATSS